MEGMGLREPAAERGDPKGPHQCPAATASETLKRRQFRKRLLSASIPGPFPDITLNRWTLSFPKELEEAFSEDYFRRSLRHVRLALFLAVCFYSIFGLLASWMLPSVREELWIIHHAFFCPALLGVLAFSYTRRFKTFMQLALSATVFLAGLGVIGMIAVSRHSGTESYAAGLVLIFILGYTTLKLRFLWATLTGWTIAVAYGVSAGWLMETPVPILINNSLIYLAANISGMFACYAMEFYARKDFIRAQLLELEKHKADEATHDLERRVEERTAQLSKANRKLQAEILERRRAEEALAESEERFRSLSENSPEIIYTLDRKGAFSYVNPACQNVLGYAPEEMTGKYFIDFATRDEAPRYIDLFKKIRDGKETLNGVRGSLIHKDGSVRLFSNSGAPNFDSIGKIKGMVGLLKDITEEQKLQNQLQQSQKLEAVGTLAGGIAHDFNNLLQAVQGYADLLLLGKNEGDPGHREAQEIKRAGERAAELTRQLLTFSRKMESRLRPVDLNQEIGEICKILRRTIPKMIEIELHLASDLRMIHADAAQIEQVLMNLAVNAKDAMPEGGRLIIETRNVTIEEKHTPTHLGTRPGDYVLLSVTDTGHGIKKEILQNIFEPFFTTKETGKGTGLGLAMVYGIVQSHRGHISCYSEPGHGATFQIHLPASAQAPAEKPAPCEKAPRGGKETILMVDDEAVIRELGQEILSRFGYEVVTAPDGESALEIYRKSPTLFDLVIMDLIMPGIGGKRCMEEILRVNPEAKIVVASGYSAHGPTKEAMDAGAAGFISKPYDVNQMLMAVRTGIDGRALTN
jgi:PAS domain S-box-containing protein